MILVYLYFLINIIQSTLSKCFSKNDIGIRVFVDKPDQSTLSKCFSKNDIGIFVFYDKKHQSTLSKCFSKKGISKSRSQ